MGCGGRCILKIRDVPRRHPDGPLVIQGQPRDPRCHTKASSQRPGVAWTSSTSQLAPVSTGHHHATGAYALGQACTPAGPAQPCARRPQSWTPLRPASSRTATHRKRTSFGSSKTDSTVCATSALDQGSGATIPNQRPLPQEHSTSRRAHPSDWPSAEGRADAACHRGRKHLAGSRIAPQHRHLTLIRQTTLGLTRGKKDEHETTRPSSVNGS